MSYCDHQGDAHEAFLCTYCTSDEERARVRKHQSDLEKYQARNIIPLLGNRAYRRKMKYEKRK
jgi:hypothetical protein